MGEMRIMGSVGDTKMIWDRNNEDEVKTAKKSFDDLRKKGFTAFGVKKTGEKGDVITEFNPSMEKIIMAAPMRGG